MNLVEYYTNRCLQKEWYNKYYLCGEGGHGSIFKCFSTNYRDLSSFEYYFDSFSKYEGIPRNEWDKKVTTGQEIAKQYVVNMVESFLYISKRNSEHELVYELSSRGKHFKEMLNQDFTIDEKNFLIFLYLMNAGFSKTPRYLLKTSWEILDKWENADLDNNKCISDIKEYIISEKNLHQVKNIFNYDIVWQLSFYSDKEFLKLFMVSSETEKEALKKLTAYDYEKSNKQNVLSQKYKSTNFSRPMLLNTFVIIYLSKIVKDNQKQNSSFSEFYNNLIDSYVKVFTIRKNNILEYILSNKDVFQVIYKNAISIEDDFTELYVADYKPKKEIQIPTEKIDATSTEGVEKLEAVRMVLKKLAKDKSNYRCALEDLNNCQYFTSKEEEKNYLEIHHLVPREFSYNFEDTIEFVDNYVPLCPRCHRMIHKAVDGERKALINYLFNKRHEALANHGINITIKELYEFYKIDKDNI